MHCMGGEIYGEVITGDFQWRECSTSKNRYIIYIFLIKKYESRYYITKFHEIISLEIFDEMISMELPVCVTNKYRTCVNRPTASFRFSIVNFILARHALRPEKVRLLDNIFDGKRSFIVDFGEPLWLVLIVQIRGLAFGNSLSQTAIRHDAIQFG